MRSRSIARASRWRSPRGRRLNRPLGRRRSNWSISGCPFEHLLEVSICPIHVAVDAGHHLPVGVPQDLGDGQMVDAALQHPLAEPVPQVICCEALAVLAGELAEFLASFAELFLMLLAGGEQLGPPRIVIAIEP